MTTTDTGRRVLLVAHTGRRDIEELATHAKDRLAAAGVDLVALPGEDEALGLAAIGVPAQSVELVLAMGGDGTLLRAAEVARAIGSPILGINLGRVGFLAEADADEVDAVVDAICSHDYSVSSRMTVEAVVEHHGEVIGTGWALNEVSLEKATRERILDVVVEVDGHGVSAYGCDGVLIATPTGSTAYAFSAGGPILWPSVEALLLVPSNAHALFARPLVVAPDVEIGLHIDPLGHAAVLACDGRRILQVPAGARVLVRRGEQAVKMVRLGEQRFSTRLARKFSLPVQGWRDKRR
ncbi:NAD kinase [Nakamurella antarctica]|uniref:NAD kinase n=1 Tax=Nakamurella antarctica TaxID=1902245 RepID=A0A3G8ZL74_9ACTN|nr:NAD kinase [Nakamurella antarctica]AZI57585.1 NAD kinase [Nakamurella antarctica]